MMYIVQFTMYIVDSTEIFAVERFQELVKKKSCIYTILCTLQIYITIQKSVDVFFS